jgi:hypothetical protein
MKAVALAAPPGAATIRLVSKRIAATNLRSARNSEIANRRREQQAAV